MEVTKGRILLVEDHADSCDLMMTFLEPLDYEVWPACTVADGLRLAQSVRFDLYLLDHRLPDGTGAELCQKLRRLHARTPILFLSGADSDADRQQAFTAGAQAFLLKPYDLEELASIISRLIHHAAWQAAA